MNNKRLPSSAINKIFSLRKMVVGLSGGVDSIVLLHLLTELNKKATNTFELRSIHINHGISVHSDSWESFCVTTAEKLSVPIDVIRVKVETRSNLEANARQARYSAIKRNIKIDEHLVTGHHLDDQVETLLLALKRGTGLDGLCGMAELSHVHGISIFRPLLEKSREWIEGYALAFGLEWIEDQSNNDESFDRNFLRKNIIPMLYSRWPSFKQSVGRSAKACQNTREAFEELSSVQLAELTNDPRFLSAQNLQLMNKELQISLVKEWLKLNGAPVQSFAKLNEIYRSVINSRVCQKPKFYLGKNQTLTRQGDCIQII